jgi:hypothetical protein
MKPKVDLPKETRCFDCRYRMSRLIKPIDPKDFEEYEIDENTLILEHMCCMTEDDIGNVIILICSRYEKENLNASFIDERFFT